MKYLLSALAALALVAPDEARALDFVGEQVLFVVDVSGSMKSDAFATPASPSRFEAVQVAFPAWLDQIGPFSRAGLVTVGGGCGSEPAVDLPVGTDPADLQSAVANLSPGGGTPLNEVLLSLPSRFEGEGRKRAVLLSDGLNECPTALSTCDIARELKERHGIVVDVYSFLSKDDGQLSCIAAATGGDYYTPDTVDELKSMPGLGSIDPWPLVAFGTAMMVFFRLGPIGYRQLKHGVKMSPRRAAMMSSTGVVVASIVAYLVLLVGASWVVAVAGAFVFALLFGHAVVGSGSARGRVTPSRRSGPLLGMLLAVATAIPNAEAAEACQSVVDPGPARHHHILAPDLSGTMKRYLDENKELLLCYVQKFTRPGEKITLLAFGTDSKGTVRHHKTFDVPETGVADVLGRELDELTIPNPRKTRTYFRPLSDRIKELLETQVALTPVVLVISDGKSDGIKDFRRKKIDFEEIPFERFGKRGIFAVPGAKGWKVAVAGGADLDFSALFSKPLKIRKSKPRRGISMAAAVDSCLLDPPLSIRTPDSVAFEPHFWPWNDARRALITIHVKAQCATRFRTFDVNVELGDDEFKLHHVDRAPIGTEERAFTFPIELPANTTATDLRLSLQVDQGRTHRSISSLEPVKLVVPTWTERHLAKAIGGGVATILFIALIVILLKRHKKRRRTAPEKVRVPGGDVVELEAGVEKAIGGAPHKLLVPGVDPNVILAWVFWNGTRGRVKVRPQRDVRLTVDGVEVATDTERSLPCTLDLTDSAGRRHSVQLQSAAGATRKRGPRSGSTTKRRRPAINLGPASAFGGGAERKGV